MIGVSYPESTHSRKTPNFPLARSVQWCLVMKTTRNLGFSADLQAMIALRDAKARENAERRAACMASEFFARALAEEASRTGRSVDWTEYFRGLDINHP